MNVFTDEAIQCLLFAQLNGDDKKKIKDLHMKVSEGMVRRAEAMSAIRKEIGE
jgi:hypothetical protein